MSYDEQGKIKVNNEHSLIKEILLINNIESNWIITMNTHSIATAITLIH